MTAFASLSKKRRGGFTLIELMIVVAILGILAAVAIPNFRRFQMRGKTSEGKVNLAAIRTAQEGYFSEFDTYVQSTATPAALIGSQRIDWPGALGCPQCFDTVGWAPEGLIYFQYEVVTSQVAAPPGVGQNSYIAGAVADVDGDAATQSWGYVRPTDAGADPDTNLNISGDCALTGMYNPVSLAQDRQEYVGPCRAQDGQSVF